MAADEINKTKKVMVMAGETDFNLKPVERGICYIEQLGCRL
jgi:hypothetical protein